MPRVTVSQKSLQQEQKQHSTTLVNRSVRWKTNAKVKKNKVPQVESSSSNSPSVGASKTKKRRSGILKNKSKGAVLTPSDSSRSSKTKPCKALTMSKCIPPPLPFSRPTPRAVAVDTRILQTLSGDAAGTIFIEKTLEFLQQCARRGVLPECLATPYATMTKNRMNIQARVATLPTHELMDINGWNKKHDVWNIMLIPIRIKAQLNSGITKNTPKNLLASETWRLFGDLVEIIVSGSKSIENAEPKQIVLITSDTAIFTDLRQGSHLKAFQRFRDRTKKFFSDGTLGSVQIHIMDTGARATASFIKNNPTCEQDISTNLSLSPSEDEESSSAHLSMSHLIHAFHQENRKTDDTTNIELSMIECNRIRFNSIVQSWVREAVGGSYLTFQLPETMDGTCSISLDLEYKVLPNSILSAETNNLISLAFDLRKADIVVLQVIPIIDIDSSLLYGVPMVAKSGLLSDISRTNEMQILVCSLWKWLIKNDVALLLRSTYKRENGNAYDVRQDHFILMTDALPGENERSLFSQHTTGILFRYADAEKLLLESSISSNLSKNGHRSELTSVESDDQYFEFIDRSMEFVDRLVAGCSVNPLFLPFQSEESPTELHLSKNKSDDRTRGSIEKQTRVNESENKASSCGTIRAEDMSSNYSDFELNSSGNTFDFEYN